MCNPHACGLLNDEINTICKVIRQDFTIEAYDTLRRLCNRLADRLGLVVAKKECPSEIEQAVCTIIWAADKAEVISSYWLSLLLSKLWGSEMVAFEMGHGEMIMIM